MKGRYSNKLKLIIFSLAALLIIVVSMVVYSVPDNKLHSVATDASIIEKDVENILKQFDAKVAAGLFNDFENIKKDNFAMHGKFSIVVQQDAKLVFWTNTTYLFLVSDTATAKPIGVKATNLDFVFYSRLLSNSSNKRVSIYIPIKYNFKPTTAILKNTFIKSKYGNADWDLTPAGQAADALIKVRSNVLFGIQTNKALGHTDIEDATTEVILVLPLLLLLICLHYIALLLCKNHNKLLVSAVLLGVLVALRLANLHFNLPIDYGKYYLFSTNNFYSDLLFRSIGDTIVNCIITIYFLWFIRLQFGKHTFQIAAQWTYFAQWIFILFLVFGFAIQLYFFKVVQDLVAYSAQPFGPTFLEVIDENLLLSVLALVLLFTTMFQLILNLVRFGIHVFKLTPASIFISTLAIVVLFCLGVLFFKPIESSAIIYFLVIHVGAFLLLLFTNIRFNINPFSTKIYLFVLLLAFVITGYLYTQQHSINYKLFQNGTAVFMPKRDVLKENALDSVAQKMQTDAYFKSKILDKNWTVDSINNYLGTKYLNGIFEYDNYQFTIVEKDRIVKGNSVKSPINLERLFIKSEPIGKNGFMVIRKNKRGLDVYTLKIDLEPKLILFVEVKRELFVETKNDPIVLNVVNDKISLHLKNAKYRLSTDNKIVYQTKNFEEPADVSLIGKMKKITKLGNLVYYKYAVGSNKQMVFTNRDMSLFKTFNIFGFLFTFIFIIVLAFLIVYNFIITKGRFLLFSKFIKLNLRVRVLAAQLLLQGITFGILFVAGSAINKNNVYKKNSVLFAETNQLVENAIIKAATVLENNAFPKGGLTSVATNVLDSIQKSVKYNFDLFGADAKVIYSSKPLLYANNYFSSYTMPKYLDNNLDNITQPIESIGDYKFVSTYKKMSVNALGKSAYLRIPFYTILKDGNKDFILSATNYFNIFVLIFLITTLFSYLISIFFSRSLTRLASSVGQLDVAVTNKNSAIDWPYYDEVRILVDQYRKVEKELKVSIAQLTERERDAAWREMAKQVAHEIKNPITPIKLSLQNMQRRIESVTDTVLYGKLHASINAVLEQIESLDKIATSFGEFAEVPVEKKVLLHVNEAIRTQINLLKNNKNNIKVNLQLCQQNVIVFMDADYFKRIVNNLVLNAMQAIDEKPQGEITVKTQFLETQQLVRLQVVDNGLGMSEIIQDKIFHADFTTKATGKGLGLAMCKDLVARSNGQISFTSAVNVGTSFVVDLPLKK